MQIITKNVIFTATIFTTNQSTVMKKDKLPKPSKKKYGWQDGGAYEETGWMIEGGEEEYYKALIEYQKQEGIDTQNTERELYLLQEYGDENPTESETFGHFV